MATINVTTREGNLERIEAAEGEPLMVALRDQNMEVEATCGGQLSCATCHIHVAPQWFGKVDAAGDEELELLMELAYSTEHSRLSCQIIVHPALDGFACTVAPFEG